MTARDDGGDGAGCLFCAIGAGRRDAQVVLDDAGVLAFLDIRPVFPGHTLVVPRQHVPTLTDAAPDVVAAVFGAARRVAAAAETALGADGTFVAVNNRVSQSVPHLHVHVVPRRFKDGLRGFFWPRQSYGSEREMAETAARLRSALAG